MIPLLSFLWLRKIIATPWNVDQSPWSWLRKLSTVLMSKKITFFSIRTTKDWSSSKTSPWGGLISSNLTKLTPKLSQSIAVRMLIECGACKHTSYNTYLKMILLLSSKSAMVSCSCYIRLKKRSFLWLWSIFTLEKKSRNTNSQEYKMKLSS